MKSFETSNTNKLWYKIGSFWNKKFKSFKFNWSIIYLTTYPTTQNTLLFSFQIITIVE